MKNLSLIILFFSTLSYASVEHKDEFIDVYLSNISDNMNEKTEILEHISRHPGGTYIDIGTGGDAVATITSLLPQNTSPTLIAADIDPLVLESIKKRRPEVLNFMIGNTGPKVELHAMSATQMDPIKDNTISGISASALVHEIFSYIPSKSPVDQFVQEICRTLEKGGVFIYRDPKWVDEPLMSCTLVLKNDISKYYSILFLAKFLDRNFTSHVDYKNDCCKPTLYSPENIKINAYVNTKNTFQRFSFDQFIQIPSSMINYTKNFSIDAPKGLIAEIQRHYLMFLKNYYIGKFLNPCTFDFDLKISTLLPEEQQPLLSYIKRKSIPCTDGIICKTTFPKFFREEEKIKDIFEKGLHISLKNKPDLKKFISKLNFSQINRNHLYLKNEKTLVIDPIILSILFKGKKMVYFNIFNMTKTFHGICSNI